MAVSDPGFVRLHKAAATALTVLLTIGVMIGFIAATGDALPVAVLGVIVSMQAAWAVKDRTVEGRLLTTFLLPLPAAGSMALASVLMPYGKLADVGFILVLFVAVWVRRFGPRGQALGMLGFISYFFALFLHVELRQLPSLVAAIVLGVAVAFTVRRWLMPDRPRGEVRRLARALRATSSWVLAVPGPDRAHDVEELRRRLARLADTGLLIEDWLDRNDASLHLDVTGHELSLKLFEAQIATEQLAIALWSLGPQTRWPPQLGKAMTAVASTLQDRPSAESLRAARRLAAEAARGEDSAGRSGLATLLALRVVQAHTAIHRITAHATADPSPSPVPKPHAEPEVSESRGLDPNTRAAIQVAVATSAATILGELVSPARWYWAVLTAFLVFTGVSTRGEILTKAGNRVAGTVVGVAAGVLLALVVGQRPVLQLALIVVCVFFAFWLVSVSYGWLAFFMTVMLAMLYGLLGRFSIDVLELRIYETAVGAVVGIAAAYFVLPVKTRATFVDAVERYLAQMSELIEESVEAVLTRGDGQDLVTHARALDTELQAVLTAGKPLVFGPTSRGRRGTRRLLRVLQVAGQSAHALARTGVNAAGMPPEQAPSPETAAALRDAAALVRERIDLAAKVVVGKGPVVLPERMVDSPVLDVLETAPNEPGPLRASVRSLSRLLRTIMELLG
ncbi:FUSC family protein [Rhodococcus sp. D2-41]|nr:FUSC family protein [Rhodococcus sp. D2-41]